MADTVGILNVLDWGGLQSHSLEDSTFVSTTERYKGGKAGLEQKTGRDFVRARWRRIETGGMLIGYLFVGHIFKPNKSLQYIKPAFLMQCTAVFGRSDKKT